ncbi:hypothetical protein IX339_001390 [Porphyromonas levii]|uniref:DUF2141 domain-containing protein n=1 Tax=Porphyromonas levii TaxID=28114 RepID=UPI001B8D1067|nr:DUF2141 domain-containing protein [Porphyromonas levii]MBR8731935.1 hypothetical protein [Porphyromonas levii]MBR8773411.1 hypothetical protein [Porphyromonas levii]
MNAIKRMIFPLAILAMCLGGVAKVFAQSEQETIEANLKIFLKGLECNEGRIMIAVFNAPDLFLMKPFKAIAIPADSISSIPVSLNLPRGIYAIALFQDANNNGILDIGNNGIPTEKYGFSNDVEPVTGPPSFKDCSFEIEEDTTVMISMR